MLQCLKLEYLSRLRSGEGFEVKLKQAKGWAELPQ
jgi:hypothetical protein